MNPIIEKNRPSNQSTRWDYHLGNSTYIINIDNLVGDYKRYKKMSKKDFEAHLPEIIHFAVFVSFYKDLDSMQTLSDVGIVHQLVHLLHFAKIEGEYDSGLYLHTYTTARKQFKILELKLPNKTTNEEL